MTANHDRKPLPLGERNRDDDGMLDEFVARAAALVTGTEPPKLFTEIGRHPALFRAWLPFARQLLLRGTLPKDDAELVILRTAFNCGSEYEWQHHVRRAGRAGFTPEEIRLLQQRPVSRAWSPHRRLLIRATDELHANRAIGPGTRRRLLAEMDERQLVELCLLVGHYEMLAMLLNTNQVEPDREASSHWSKRRSG
jgi:alkylhydroperoxidase family enzyme